MKMLRLILLALLSLTLSACGFFFDKDNSPTPKALTSFTSEFNPQIMWTANSGKGAGKENLKMAPASDHNALYTANVNGAVTSVNKQTGALNWKVKTGLDLTSGPGAGKYAVAVGSSSGDVITHEH